MTKFERSKLINKIFGNSIKNTFKISKHFFDENKDKIETGAIHNGYEKEFGCLYKRKILIEKTKNNLKGFDEIIRNKDNKTVNYCLRFHLYPGLTAVKTMSGNTVLIQLSKNKSLIFTIKDEKIFLEKGIFLGSNKILNNTCVSVTGNLINKSKVIQWEIKKNIIVIIDNASLNKFNTLIPNHEYNMIAKVPERNVTIVSKK